MFIVRKVHGGRATYYGTFASEEAAQTYIATVLNLEPEPDTFPDDSVTVEPLIPV